MNTASLNFSRDPDGARVLDASQWVPHPLDQVFDFFSRAHNLEKLTPPHLRFRILTPEPIVMREGLIINYRIGLHGIPMPWRSRITRWEPPHAFADFQERGPYRLWDHLHTFAAENGGTRITDRIRFRIPVDFPPVSTFVLGNLTDIFTYRQKVIREVFPAPAATPDLAAAS